MCHFYSIYNIYKTYNLDFLIALNRCCSFSLHRLVLLLQVLEIRPRKGLCLQEKTRGGSVNKP